jgi:serpin B
MRIARRFAVVVGALAVVAGCSVGGASPSPSALATPGAEPTASPPAVPTAAPSPPATSYPAPAVRHTPSDVPGIAALEASVPRASGDPETIGRLVAGDNGFAAGLYHAVADGANRNLVVSPYSAMAALAMAFGGARGTTAEEMAAALRVGDDPGAWHAARNALAQQVAAPPEPTDTGDPFVLESTNALFGQAGYAFQPAFLDLLATDYGAPLMTVDYAADPDRARAAINAWVAARTRGRIPELLAPEMVTQLTRFGLVNAVYFKGSWAQHFATAKTRPGAFHRLDGSSANVPTMHGQIPGEYAHSDGWQAIRLWYAGGRTVMTIVIPDDGRFTEVERTLDGQLLSRLASDDADWEFDRLTLALPRWSAATSVDLKSALPQLGVRALFKAPPGPGSADLDGIASDNLFVGAAIQKATITVDENGTEAAAATAVMGGTTGGSPVARTLAIDRPFLYLVTDQASGTVLFMGRVLDPSR